MGTSIGGHWQSPSKEAGQMIQQVRKGGEERRNYMLQMAAAGINSAKARVLDFELRSQKGEKNSRYVATAAWAKSPVETKAQGAYYFYKKDAQNKEFEVAATVSADFSIAPIINFQKALEFEPFAKVQAAIKYGKDASSGASIDIVAKMDQTQDRRDYVQDLPIAKQCLAQMEEGNQLLFACRNATAMANIMDRFELVAHYQRVGNELTNATYSVYKTVRQLANDHVEEDWVSHSGKDKQIEFQMRLSPNLRRMNATLSAPKVYLALIEIPVGSYAQSLLAAHPNVNIFRAVNKQAYGNEGFGECAGFIL